VHQTVRYKLKAKLKVARPTHRLRAEIAVVDFKKKALWFLPVLLTV